MRDIVPAKVRIVKIIRRKYQDPEDPDRGVIMADLPPRLIDKGNASEALLSHVLCAKFLDHMPLHEALQKRVQKSHYLQVDETRRRCRTATGRAPRTGATCGPIWPKNPV